MRRLAGLLSGVALFAACAGSAAAQGGAGLYEPFPEAPRTGASRDYLKGLSRPGPALARDLTGAQLERGVRMTAAEVGAAALPARAAVGPASRANPGGTAPGAGWLAALGLIAAAIAAPVLLRRVRG